VRELAERAYFRWCLWLGWLLRSSRYSTAQIVDRDGERHVRKSRAGYAPFLIWMSRPLMRMLDTGVRVLPQQQWAEREGRIYGSVYGRSIRIDTDGAVVLPYLAGRTLASWLEAPALDESLRRRSIGHALAALAELHRLGITHADAMAENVMVDLDAGVACWFDFETVHETQRPMTWRRADDLRALLVTCLRRTRAEQHAETLHFILDAYDDERLTRLLAASFTSIWRRPLAFHLGQARLSLRCYRDIARWLDERIGGRTGI
jgi:hypothetical protein